MVRKSIKGSLLPHPQPQLPHAAPPPRFLPRHAHTRTHTRDYASLLHAHLEMAERVRGAARLEQGAVAAALQRYSMASQGMCASVLACLGALQAHDR